MLRRMWLVLVSVISLFTFTQYAKAAELNSSNYNIYIGDINNDGLQDFVFSAKRAFLILHGDIATPILFVKDMDLVVYRDGMSYSSPVAFALTQADIAAKVSAGTLKLAVENTDYFVWKNGVSTQSNLLLRGADSVSPALLLTSYSDISFPAIAQIYSPERFKGISTSTVKLTITDNNGDGLKDILLEDQTVAAWKTAYLANSSAVPINFKEVAASTTKPVIPLVTKPVEGAVAVGSIPYSAGVDNKGAATISIPIRIPQGINGMQPQLSLNFNSGGLASSAFNQTTSGWLGFGWGLSGISSINRCTAGKLDIQISKSYLSLPDDKSITKRPPLAYNDTDSLCLNGELLVLVSGSNLQPGAQYHTLTESFKLITVKGTAAEPWFEVRNPNGSVASYGHRLYSSARKIIDKNTTNLTPYFEWSIDSETDSFGNKIDYLYNKTNEAFSYQSNKTRIFPALIVYPGGAVELNYTTVIHIPPTTGYVDYGPILGVDHYDGDVDVSDQLASVRVSSDADHADKLYTLVGNIQTPTTAPTQIDWRGLQLNSITECNYLNSTTVTTCLPTLSFNWNSNLIFEIVNGSRIETAFTYSTFISSAAQPNATATGVFNPYRGRIGIDQIRYNRFLDTPYDIPELIKSAINNNTPLSANAKWELPTNLTPTNPTPLTLVDQSNTVVAVMEKNSGLINSIDPNTFIPIEQMVLPTGNTALVLTDRQIMSYSYGYSAKSKLGLGALGFDTMRITNHTTGVVTYNQYGYGSDWDINYYRPSKLAATYQYNGFYNYTIGDTNLISKSETRQSVVPITQANGNKTYLPVVNQITSSTYESGTLVGTTIKNNEYQLNAGLITQIKSTVVAGGAIDATSIKPQIWWGLWDVSVPLKLTNGSIKSTEVTTSNFTNSTAANDWRIGFTNSKQKVLYNGAIDTATDTKTQTASYTPKAGTMAIETATLFSGDAENQLTSSFTYDGQGRQLTSAVSGANVEARTTTTDSFARSVSMTPGRIVNALGHVVTNSDIDLRFDQPKTITDANGLIAKQEFDSWGRVVMVTDVNGVPATQTYKNCGGSGGVTCNTVTGKLGAITPMYLKEIVSPLSPTIREYYDTRNRVIRTEKDGFIAGELFRTDVQYDGAGRVYKTSLPYKSTTTPQWTTNTYDLLGRVILTTLPTGGTVTTAYTLSGTGGQQQLVVTKTEKILKADATIDSTSAGTPKKISYFNSIGQLVKTDDDIATTSYEYDALGNAIKTIVNGGADGSTTSTTTYDNAGNRTSITDPNAGTITSKYTALGQLRWMKDNQGNETSLTYDKLGRSLTRTSVDGTSNWVYDPVGAKGNLWYTTNNNGYTQTYFYEDNYRAARLSRIETTISVPEVGLSGKTYTEYVNYDVYGRAQKTVSPSGFGATQNYNAQGYPSTLYRGDNASLLQTTQQIGAFGVEQESLPDGSTTQRVYDPKSGLISSIKTNNGATKVQDLTYQWRTNGSLESRTNNKSGTPIIDNFAYDNLDRLKTTETKIGSAIQRTLTQDYNNLGNITSNISSQTADAQVTGYQYKTATNTRPHAISTATISGIAYSFTYDQNGAITVYDAAGTNPDKFIAYNAANQPTKITVGTSLNDASPIARDEFRYAPDGARYYKKTTYKEGTRLRAEYTFYVGGYETTYYDAFSTLKQSEKTQVGASILSIRKTPYSGLITESLEVLHRDHLGSVDAVTVGTATVANLAFEPFGARRSSNLLSNITTTEMTNLLAKTDVLNSQGYTGHESLDRTGLIHMNGRVYDPQLGRFLSPDPIVQSPSNSQSWNRYSYVFNNPLKYTDPTGFQCIQTVHYTSNDGDHWRQNGAPSFSGDCQVDEVDHRGSSDNGDGWKPPETYKPENSGQQQEQQSITPTGERGGESIMTTLLDECSAGSLSSCSQFNDLRVATGEFQGVYINLALQDFYKTSLSQAAGGLLGRIGGAFSASKIKELWMAYKAEKFFANTTLAPRVLKQIRSGDNHAFPGLVDDIAKKAGKVESVLDSRGNSVQMLTLNGERNGVSGTYEYIKNNANEIYHRFFNPK